MSPENFKSIPICERIFCNRSLNMSSIKAIGFDMDYTLAIYKHETFEKLAYHETLKKLIPLGYPEEILTWEFDSKYMIRGLVVDKKRGNILKTDRHRYVKVAYHGFAELTRNERHRVYDVENVMVYEEPDFALIDTIFSLAEAFLFAQMVDFKEKSNCLNSKSFYEIHADIRKCIDLSHRDGSIKDEIALHPENFIKFDPHLRKLLNDLKISGRKLFIVTNSLWNYTNVVMNYLLPYCSVEQKNWTSYFDIIITGSQKPQFFMSKNPLYEVDEKTGFLKNIDLLCEINSEKKAPFIYQSGHVKLLHELLSIQKGSEILYVGDHIYGDILRSKKEIGWRTMLVIEELEDEMNKLVKYKETIQSSLPEEYLKYFHPVWGPLMKTGPQNSRFSAQVMNYACLYTCKLSNLRHYNFNTTYQAVRDLMPHDFDYME